LLGLRGVLRSGFDGAYELRTIVPGHYGRRARHIHFHAKGYEPFVTQSYFPDDPARRNRSHRLEGALLALQASIRAFGRALRSLVNRSRPR